MERRNFLKTAGAGSAAFAGLAAIPACSNGAGGTGVPIDPESLKLLSVSPQRQVSGIEPTLEEAINYWPDLENIYTPLGWPDHLYDFTVLWNGGIVAKPAENQRVSKHKGLGAFFRMLPRSTKRDPKYNYVPGHWQDTNFTQQRWKEDSPAPVHITRWVQDGVVLESSVFAYTPSGRPVKQGDEPLYAWVRLSVVDLVEEGLPLEKKYGFSIVIESTRMVTENARKMNVFWGDDRTYPRHLYPKREEYNRETGYYLLEDGEKVRIGVAPGAECSVELKYTEGGIPGSSKTGKMETLSILCHPEPGTHVDLLIPILPTEQDEFSTQLDHGYERALDETERFWESQIGATEAAMDLPEAYLNKAIRANIWFSLMNTERNPATGKFMKVRGTFPYHGTWTHTTVLEFTRLLDTLGYHDTVDKYMEIFIGEQGSVTPPGEVFQWDNMKKFGKIQMNPEESGAFKKHPGFLTTPLLYQMVFWLADNGALLYSMAMHGLRTGDQKFIEKYIDVIIKSCEWIRDVRAQTNHEGYPGVLPPGIDDDDGHVTQSIFNVGWNYMGLSKSAALLQRIGHPRGEEFEKEREGYRADFLKAYFDKYATMPEWTDAQGKKRKFAPTVLFGDDPAAIRSRYYLPLGPLFLVFTGLLPATDPTMKDTMDWFREGPQVAWYKRETDTRKQLPILEREMASTVPVYSWNLFHSLQTGDRERFLTGLYSLWAGSISRETFIPTENRGNMIGFIATVSTPIYLSRLALVDDFSIRDEVHLLRMVPSAWLKGRGFRLTKIPTEYGPVNLSGKMDQNGTLEISYSATYHWEPAKIVLHVPPLPEIKSVTMNGKKVKGKEMIL